MTRPVLSERPAVPSRRDPRDVFESRANLFLAWLIVFGGELDLVMDYLEELEAAAEAQAADAASQAAAAAQSVPAVTQALALVGAYTERHQGSHAAPPTLRNDGTALQAGDLYYRSTTPIGTYVWSGSAWAAYDVGGGRMVVRKLGEAQTTDFVAAAGQAVWFTKDSAPVRMRFPAAAVDGDELVIGNASSRVDHLLNGNGNPVQGSTDDVVFTYQNDSLRFMFVSEIGWRVAG